MTKKGLPSPVTPAVKRSWILAVKGQWRIPFMGTLVDVKWLGSMFRAAGSFLLLPQLPNSERKGGVMQNFTVPCQFTIDLRFVEEHVLKKQCRRYLRSDSFCRSRIKALRAASFLCSHPAQLLRGLSQRSFLKSYWLDINKCLNYISLDNTQ